MQNHITFDKGGVGRWHDLRKGKVSHANSASKPEENN